MSTAATTSAIASLGHSVCFSLSRSVQAKAENADRELNLIREMFETASPGSNVGRNDLHQRLTQLAAYSKKLLEKIDKQRAMIIDETIANAPLRDPFRNEFIGSFNPLVNEHKALNERIIAIKPDITRLIPTFDANIQKLSGGDQSSLFTPQAVKQKKDELGAAWVQVPTTLFLAEWNLRNWAATGFELREIQAFRESVERKSEKINEVRRLITNFATADEIATALDAQNKAYANKLEAWGTIKAEIEALKKELAERASERPTKQKASKIYKFFDANSTEVSTLNHQLDTLGVTVEKDREAVAKALDNAIELVDKGFAKWKADIEGAQRLSVLMAGQETLFMALGLKMGGSFVDDEAKKVAIVAGVVSLKDKVRDTRKALDVNFDKEALRRDVANFMAIAGIIKPKINERLGDTDINRAWIDEFTFQLNRLAYTHEIGATTTETRFSLYYKTKSWEELYFNPHVKSEAVKD